MCIAIYKPAGVPVPSLATLQACADSNGDGAGISYPCVGGKVQIIKGMGSAEEVFEALNAQDFTNGPVMIHFRIGTHGLKTDAKHTHPFPVGATTEVMEKLVHQCDHAVMHNGILGSFGYEKAISDTMAFARDFLPLILHHLDNPGVKAAMTEVLSWDKVAIMAADGSVRMFGNWIKSDGIFYSNESFRSFGGADPRKWGKTTDLCTWSRDYDPDEDFAKDEKEPFRPFKGQLWSDGLTWDGLEAMEMFDSTHLRADHDAAVEFGAAMDAPKPIGCTEIEYDAWVVYSFITKKFTEKQLIGYLETGVVMREVETTKKTRRRRTT